MRTLSALLLTLGDPGRMTGGYLYHRRMAGLAPRCGASLSFLSVPDGPFPLPVLSGAAVLARASSSKTDILVLDSIAAACLGPWLAARRPDVPLVAMLHQPPGGIDHGPLRSAIQAAFDRLAYRRARHLMVASESLMAELAAGGMPRAAMTVVPPGRDPAPSTDRSPMDLRRGRKAAILCVGNWVERKGIHSLLDAFARLPGDLATLHLVGNDRADPAYADRLRKRLLHPDLSGRVVVHGPLPQETVAMYYRSADLFALPSLREPYGTVYGEAMAAGLPVVGWFAGNLPYLARDGQEGLMVAPGDLEGLSRALARIAEDQALRARLGAAALQRARTFPTWEQSAALFFGTLREVAEGRGA